MESNHYARCFKPLLYHWSYLFNTAEAKGIEPLNHISGRLFSRQVPRPFGPPPLYTICGERGDWTHTSFLNEDLFSKQAQQTNIYLLSISWFKETRTLIWAFVEPCSSVELWINVVVPAVPKLRDRTCDPPIKSGMLPPSDLRNNVLTGRDSNSHWTGSKPASSSVGIPANKNGDFITKSCRSRIRTRTDQSQILMPYQLGDPAMFALPKPARWYGHK